MIFGNGLIANELEQSNFFDDYNIIAKGVSNSKEIDEEQYERQEIEILQCIKTIKNQFSEKRTIYISSIISDPQSIYFKKKVEVENILKSEFNDLIIVRLTNVVGLNQNPNNLFKFFLDQISSNNKLHVNIKAVRNIIDIKDVVILLAKQLKFGCGNEINIGFKENITALHLAEIIERHLGKENTIVPYTGEPNFVGFYDFTNQFVNNYFYKFPNVDSYISFLLKKYFDKK